MDKEKIKVTDELNVDYIDHMGSDLTVVNAARVSFAKHKTVLDSKDEKLINYLAKHKHYTPFEHCSLTVKIDCPLFIRSQIHRHRTFSYNEVSRRYTEEDLRFFSPEVYRTQHKSSKQCSAEDCEPELSKAFKMLADSVASYSVGIYDFMIKSGVSKEMARGILPQNLMTQFYMTGNLRNWAGFIRLRDDEHAQLEAQLIAKQIKDIIKKNFPISFKALMEY